MHTSQRGLRTGLVHACVNSPVSGSFMYLQDLTVLGDYFQATHASARDTVSGEWPDLGFALPSGDKPLKKGEPARISSWHVAFTDQACEEPAAVAEQYLELLARLFMHIERPTPGYVDWRDRFDPRDRNYDGRVDWRDGQYAYDRNHDGRIDWRDRYNPYDRNRDGRVDWRDRYDPRDRNYDGRIDWRDTRW